MVWMKWCLTCRSETSFSKKRETISLLQTFFKDIKVEHSLFALPFAYLGLFLAEGGLPRLSLLFWVTLAMVSFRTFAMAMNRLIDRDIDAQNPRTRSWGLPQKKLTPGFVAQAAFISFLIFLGTSWILGPLCLVLSPIPTFLAVIYPYLKRFTWLCHGVLGIILGIAPYGGWLASRPEFSWIPGLLLIGVALWVSGFDILYSFQDLEFDQRSGLKSLPVRWGKERALIISASLHLMAFVAWAGMGAFAGLGWIYGAGLLLVAIFLSREHWLMHRLGLTKMREFFFTMNVGVSVTIFFAAAADLYLR